MNVIKPFWVVVLGLTLILIGMPSFAGLPALVKLAPEKIPSLTIDDADAGSWEAGSKEQLKLALTRQLDRCQQELRENPKPDYRNMGGRKVTREDWCVKPAQWFLTELEKVNSLQELYMEASHALDWYQSTGKTGHEEMLFTGYYYPEITVKKKKDAVYKYPIYKMPTNGVAPTFSRKQIENGALNGKKLEIGYAESPVDPFFLEVQGSGALNFIDEQGKVVQHVLLNFGGTNGQYYVSIGALMKAAGVPASYLNMQGIHRYFKEKPQMWRFFADRNPSYVFFKQAADGPFGSAGVLLTPKHSIAVDPSSFPLGAIAIIQTDRPASVDDAQNATSWKPFAQFVIAQDTGGAIRGPGRADLFYGSGDYAQAAAGQTENPGSLYFVLLPAPKVIKVAKPSSSVRVAQH